MQCLEKYLEYNNLSVNTSPSVSIIILGTYSILGLFTTVTWDLQISEVQHKKSLFLTHTTCSAWNHGEALPLEVTQGYKMMGTPHPCLFSSFLQRREGNMANFHWLLKLLSGSDSPFTFY